MALDGPGISQQRQRSVGTTTAGAALRWWMSNVALQAVALMSHMGRSVWGMLDLHHDHDTWKVSGHHACKAKKDAYLRREGRANTGVHFST